LSNTLLILESNDDTLFFLVDGMLITFNLYFAVSVNQ